MAATHIYTTRLLEDHVAAPWKLQMTAISSHQRLLFVALRKHIEIYRIGHYTQTPTFKVRLADPVLELSDDEINAVSLGKMQDNEVLIVVFDSGRTVVWEVCEGFRILWERRVDSSTWGCAVSSPSNMVATSTNSHTIDILQHRDQLLNEAADKRISLQEPRSTNNDVSQFQVSCQTLHGHSNNIPCVTFSATGKYLASASIDRTVRIWSMEHMECVFTFRYIQWCWSVVFVYPYYFLPAAPQLCASWPPEKSGVSTTETSCSCNDDTSSNNGERSYDTYSESQYDSGGDGAHIALLRSGQNRELQNRAETLFEVHMDHVADHTQDMLNGYVDSNTSPAATGVSNSSASSPSITGLPNLPFVPESSQPTLSSPLLLCSTRSDLLLIDPSCHLSPVVDKIERVVARTIQQPLVEVLAFDRITFLEWIPELGIAIAGAFSGTIAIVRLSTAIDDGRRNHQMHVIARIGEQPFDSQLYGVSVYRSPEEGERSSAVILYLLFLDGRLVVYELRHPRTLADSD
ncbi:WD40 repeat-like protein [Coemansia reversa NRRL 1564]|uniref:WD40 repeat-like protein n=1 Tax=Coemansia reversa (strain ATCC 12441 / NRRL 1564) TaxID=763665 RepID=A0A2G5BIC8_COERN|nr:WD40 repeat-like protein [Coemansia reversa NRRL 1564]|eukprot:PIA18770.1 WD40 repeat-like protein [Coemansia reversa NRRL 1564]